MEENKELKVGDPLPPCAKCGKVDKYLSNYHTHDLDEIFGLGDF